MSDTRSPVLSVRLAPRLEQELAAYCTAHNVSRSEAVKQALDALLRAPRNAPTAWQLGQRFRGSDKRPGDVARNTKRLLRERFR
jgi:hypothetical protein